MMNFNEFKKSVKQWIRDNPQGDLTDLRDFCEEQIPPQQYAANMWVVDQTLSWYKHILKHREIAHSELSDLDG